MMVQKNSNIKIQYILWGIFFVNFGIRMIVNCIYGVPSFDGAMNLQVPFQLIETGKYMTTYDGGILFDAKIQTRMPVLIPIYFLWKIFGVSSVSAIIVNALYLCLLMYVVYKICREMGLDKESSMIPVVLITIVPGIWEYGFGIYGEIPTLALFMCSILFLLKAEKKDKNNIYMGLAGAFFSLAFLNKTVILIAVPSFVVLFVYKLFYEKTLKLKSVLIWGGAFIVPIIFAEAYHMVQIGSIQEYIDMMLFEISEIGKQAGVSQGFSDTSNVFEKVWLHLNILQNESLIFNPIIVILILLVLFVEWLYVCFKRKKITYFSIVILVMYSYFGWWLLITPTAKAWYRRIIIGVILLLVICCVVLANVMKDIKHKKIFKYVCLFSVFLIAVTHLQASISVDKNYKTEITQLSEQVNVISKDNSDAKFYGYGWYQAPVIAIYSESTFWNLYNSGIENENSYLVVDKNSLSGGKGELTNVLRCFDSELVFENNSGAIYKINSIDVYNYKFKSELENVLESDVITTRFNNKDNEGYEGITGIYWNDTDTNVKWCSPNLEVLIKNPGYKNLCINLQVFAFDKMNNDIMRLYVYIDDILVSTQEVDSNGSYEILLSGEQVEKEGIRDIRIYADSYVKTDTDSRLLSYKINEIKYVEDER